MIHQIAGTAGSVSHYQKTETKQATEATPKGFNEADKVSLNIEEYKYASYTQKGELSVKPDSRYHHLGNLVRELLTKQGMTLSDAIGGRPYEIDQETQEEASALTAEDGYWGVEQTSDRIFQFAVSTAGDDTAKFEDIKAAIKKGFDMALDAFGGTLPEISYQTYDSVMEKLDSWADQNNGEITTENSEKTEDQ